MADNVTANAGSGGAVFATDDVAGVHYPISKLAFGALDSVTVVSAAAGLPVQQQGTWTVAAHAVSNAGVFAVQVDAALPAGSNAIGKLAANSGVDIGDVDVLTLPALPAGTNTIGAVQLKPTTAGGLSPSKTISAASTNATSVKGSAGQLYEIVVTNINAAVRYLKLYDKATAPTVGTDTPVWTLAIPGNAAGAGIAKTIPNGLAFANGIGFALTTGVADADTGAVAANELVVNLGYA